MVLFEKDGMSFYTSTDLKAWTRKSYFKGLHECPDFFELAVDGDLHHNKWILHGGSSSYFIGSFDGESFKPESPSFIMRKGQTRMGTMLSMRHNPSLRCRMAGEYKWHGEEFNQRECLLTR